MVVTVATSTPPVVVAMFTPAAVFQRVKGRSLETLLTPFYFENVRVVFWSG